MIMKKRSGLSLITLALVSLLLLASIGALVWAINLDPKEQQAKSEEATVSEQQPPANPITRQELFDLTNKERVQAGKTPLSLDQALNDTAEKKCNEIAATGTPTHDGLQALSDQLNRRMGENLAEGYDSSEQVVDAWMGSPKHKENILRDEYRRIGFGICESGQLGTVVVQHFSDEPKVQGASTSKVKNVDLDPYKYAIDPNKDYSGGFTTPEVHVQHTTSPTYQYDYSSPTVHLDSTHDGCHVWDYICN
jgi:hypothetical protein